MEDWRLPVGVRAIISASWEVSNDFTFFNDDDGVVVVSGGGSSLLECNGTRRENVVAKEGLWNDVVGHRTDSAPTDIDKILMASQIQIIVILIHSSVRH